MELKLTGTIVLKGHFFSLFFKISNTFKYKKQVLIPYQK